jgi:integrase
MLVKNKRAENAWFLRYYADVDGRRVYKKQRIGTVREFPNCRDAEKAALNLRAKINSEVTSPDTVNQLLAHYERYELTADRKSFATIEAHKSFSHGIRYQWIHHNPISKVRCSAIRQREPDVLTPEEFNALLSKLVLRERVMVLLAGTTGLRRSEMFALVKTSASKRPLPLLAFVAEELLRWRKVSLYNGDGDFLFPSDRLNGEKPLMPSKARPSGGIHSAIRWQRVCGHWASM